MSVESEWRQKQVRRDSNAITPDTNQPTSPDAKRHGAMESKLRHLKSEVVCRGRSSGDPICFQK
jgi:hypothetical protein